MSGLEVHPVTADRWRDLVELFERRGPRGGSRNSPAPGCWCMYWRNRALAHGTPKKRALGSLVRAGREPGLVGYESGVPVGWISIAPREEFRDLLRSPQYRPRDDDEDVWSVVCFVIDRPARRRGVAGALLEAAVDHARSCGGRSVEAYAHVATRATTWAVSTSSSHKGSSRTALRTSGRSCAARSRGTLDFGLCLT